jgi:LPS sulfotransferase NodH
MKSPFANRKYDKFILVSHARSGSNLIINALNSCHNIDASSEIFAGHNRVFGENYDSIINDCFSDKPEYIKAVGFKVFYYHLTNDEWKKLSDIKDLRIIHLKRINRLRTIASLDIAFKTNKWVINNESDRINVEQKRIRLDYSEVVRKIEAIEEWEIETAQRFKNHSIIEVYYEKLSTQQENSICDLLEFLGLARTLKIEINIKKQNPEPLSDLIENYNDLKEQFKNTRWYSFFDEI